MKKYVLFFAAFITLSYSSCKRDEFLNKKPATNIVAPTSLADFQSLLENTEVLGRTGGLPQLASDDYIANYSDLQLYTATERNSYIWAKDLYGGDLNIPDWNELYKEVFYANSVLDGLKKYNLESTEQGKYLKGWALFIRSFSFYDLTRNFCKVYNENTASTDLGIPLRLTSGIDYLEKRATLQQSYDRIINDLNTAVALLPEARPAQNLNRPSKISAYAALARIYLDMRKYTDAEKNADNSLALYSTLMDYNTLDPSSSTPFSTTNAEMIYAAIQGGYNLTAQSGPALVNPDVIKLYDTNDLRFLLFFSLQPDGTYYRKRGYYGVGHYPFGGLATDELYIIKAECLARGGKVPEAMDVLNRLLVTRFKKGTFKNLTASSSSQALSTVLDERRKELVWRGMRWQDVKRLNAEGAGITLTRQYNGTLYSLPPNDPRYVFPIPASEITLSGIEQNVR